jgi:hypothetical protein
MRSVFGNHDLYTSRIGEPIKNFLLRRDMFHKSDEHKPDIAKMIFFADVVRYIGHAAPKVCRVVIGYTPIDASEIIMEDIEFAGTQIIANFWVYPPPALATQLPELLSGVLVPCDNFGIYYEPICEKLPKVKIAGQRGFDSICNISKTIFEDFWLTEIHPKYGNVTLSHVGILKYVKQLRGISLLQSQAIGYDIKTVDGSFVPKFVK